MSNLLPPPLPPSNFYQGHIYTESETFLSFSLLKCLMEHLEERADAGLENWTVIIALHFAKESAS